MAQQPGQTAEPIAAISQVALVAESTISGEKSGIKVGVWLNSAEQSPTLLGLTIRHRGFAAIGLSTAERILPALHPRSRDRSVSDRLGAEGLALRRRCRLPQREGEIAEFMN
jgi:hypothetical protein